MINPQFTPTQLVGATSATMTYDAPVQVVPAPRSAVACDGCRSRKARCLPSRMQNVCQRYPTFISTFFLTIFSQSCRCLAGNVECKYTARKTSNRPVKVSATATSASSSATPPPRPPTDILSGLFTASDGLRSTAHEVNALQQLHRDVLSSMFPLTTTPSSEPSPSQPSESVSSSSPISSSASDTTRFSDGYSPLTAECAQRLFTIYDNKTHVFPFVTLPHNWSVASLLKSSPFLSLAVCCVMTTDCSLNRRLDAKFRAVLSQKVVVESERSIDLFQGLLVYLAWFPIHINPRARQPYHLLGMAINMAEDYAHELLNGRASSLNQLELCRAIFGAFSLASA